MRKIAAAESASTTSAASARRVGERPQVRGQRAQRQDRKQRMHPRIPAPRQPQQERQRDGREPHRQAQRPQEERGGAHGAGGRGDERQPLSRRQPGPPRGADIHRDEHCQGDPGEAWRPHPPYCIRTAVELNPAQAAAVAHGDGPLLILAAPGRGKTRVITARIAELLRRAVVRRGASWPSPSPTRPRAR